MWRCHEVGLGADVALVEQNNQTLNLNKLDPNFIENLRKHTARSKLRVSAALPFVVALLPFLGSCSGLHRSHVDTSYREEYR